MKLAASPGFAPGPPVSETGALLITRRGMVAREGSAPPTSGCRPDAMLFHHRAVEFELRKLAAGDGFAAPTSLSKSDEFLITPSRNELVEPEVVATSPCPVKSRVPVCCGFDSAKGVNRKERK